MPKEPPSKTTPCKKCPLRTNPCYRAFEGTELKFIEGFKTGELVIEAGEQVLIDGHDSAHLYTVLEGWAIRLKYLPDGGRQILNMAMPGDLLGLQSSLFGSMQHSVETLTRVKLCVFPRSRLFELVAAYPGLGFDITWLAAREEAMLAEHLVNVGQRSAFVRMSYFFAHLFDRAKQANLTEGNKVALPLTQEHIADSLGLSAVHTNKTLRKIRATRCIDWSRGELIVNDSDMLHELGEYEPYDGPPRPFI
ncbi:MAG: Crp/Fnr family transcriptional regulator [Alphaproteobacteria bacterium]|nr:Crp/Fnr family transcriptional regulator [Alphaproteobacteria bacterium]